MIARKIIYLDSSNATTKDLTRGLARFEYPQPIEPFTPSVKIAVCNFAYTNFFINITAPNNVIYYSNNALLPQKYTITIPTGSWGLSDLNDYISSTQLAQTGVGVFTIQPNYSTGKVSIVFGNVINWFVNITANTPTILGFAVGHVPVSDANTAYYTEEAANAASFNNITQIKISSDIAQDSIDNTSLSSNVIYISTPSVPIGSVQVDQPFHLLPIESTRLTGKVSSLTFQIIDQLNRPVTLSEDFTITIMVI